MDLSAELKSRSRSNRRYKFTGEGGVTASSRGVFQFWPVATVAHAVEHAPTTDAADAPTTEPVVAVPDAVEHTSTTEAADASTSSTASHHSGHGRAFKRKRGVAAAQRQCNGRSMGATPSTFNANSVFEDDDDGIGGDEPGTAPAGAGK